MKSKVMEHEKKLEHTVDLPVVPSVSSELRERLIKDYGVAETQLRGVVNQLEEIQRAQQTLLQQKIALETLVNYLKILVGEYHNRK